MPRRKGEGDPPDRVRVQHMLIAAREAISFSAGRDRRDLLTDRLLARGLIHAVLEIGEAAKNVSAEARAFAPSIEWDRIARTRDFLVHVYWGIDNNRLWETVLNHLPPLIERLEALLTSWPQGDPEVASEPRPGPVSPWCGSRGGRALGVDGCRHGWVVVDLDRLADVRVFASVGALWDMLRSGDRVLIDVPIGLPSERRECDRLARGVLPGRASCVFSTPPRASVYADSIDSASAAWRAARGGKGLSKQAWAIVPKIREVDELVLRHPAARLVIRECHPEVCFRFLAGRVIVEPKDTSAGIGERVAWLERVLPGAKEALDDAISRLSRQARPDDIVDAMVAAWCAGAEPDELRTLPTNPPQDERGLAVEMVYRVPRLSH